MGFPSIVRCSISLIFDHQLSDLERKVNAVNQYTWPCLPLHLGGIELLESNGNDIFSSAHDQNGVAYRSASFQLAAARRHWSAVEAEAGSC